MRTDFPCDYPSDLQASDFIFDSTKWDRRRRGQVRGWAMAFLESAATYLIEDQMRAGRKYSPGAVDAVDMLRACIASIDADEMLHQRGERAAASWLPKQMMAKQRRSGPTDA